MSENGIALFCCGKKINFGNLFFLKDISNFTARKMFTGKCPVCNEYLAVITEKRITDGKMYIDEFKGIEAVKATYREKKRVVSSLPNIQSDNLFGWIYGVNVEIKNKKGKIVQLRQYASDFANNKTLVKRIYAR